MRKTIAVAAVLVAACAAQVDVDAEGLRAALPAEDSIRIVAPAPDPAATPATAEVTATAAAPAVGSDYAGATYRAAQTVNAGIAFTLARVRAIAALPPTTCDELSCTWGPWPDGDRLNAWRLVARHEAAGWAYALDARPVSAPAAPFVPIVAGVARAGTAPLRGSGSFAVDFDAAAALAHPEGWQQEDFGRVEVAYDARAELRVDATGRGVRSGDPADAARQDATYAFRRTGDGGGELTLASETLEAVPRAASLRSRWTADGAGRGDARWIADGVTREASECWSAAALGFALVFDTDPPAGDAGLCAFPDAAFAALPAP